MDPLATTLGPFLKATAARGLAGKQSLFPDSYNPHAPSRRPPSDVVPWKVSEVDAADERDRRRRAAEWDVDLDGLIRNVVARRWPKPNHHLGHLDWTHLVARIAAVHHPNSGRSSERDAECKQSGNGDAPTSSRAANGAHERCSVPRSRRNLPAPGPPTDRRHVDDGVVVAFRIAAIELHNPFRRSYAVGQSEGTHHRPASNAS